MPRLRLPKNKFAGMVFPTMIHRLAPISGNHICCPDPVGGGVF